MKNELVETIREYNQWVVHDEKKRPFQPGNGHFADVSDPSTWTNYETVKGCKRKGFVLTAEDPFTTIDLDHCIGAQGKVQSQTSKILMYFQSYTEVSPSGTGFHIWVRGKIPNAIKRTEFEIYSELRYMTVTGNAAFNCPLANCQLQLDKVYEKYSRSDLSNQMEDYETKDCKEDLRKLYKVSAQLRRIWDLECDFKKADGSPDCSSYDMALAGLLRNWSGERIMWALTFFREEHGFASKHRKALLMTISKAFENKT